MTEGWYSRRNIKEQFKKLSTVVRAGCCSGSEPAILIWIAFYSIKLMTFR